MSLHKYSIVLLALLALLCSCHDEDKGDIPQSNELTADFIVKYKDDFGIHTDYKAKVYIYYGIYSMDIVGFHYLPDGVLDHEGKEITPDIRLSADGKEDITLLLDNAEKVTVIVESSYYEGRVGITSYSPGDTPIKGIFTFGE